MSSETVLLEQSGVCSWGHIGRMKTVRYFANNKSWTSNEALAALNSTKVFRSRGLDVMRRLQRTEKLSQESQRRCRKLERKFLRE